MELVILIVVSIFLFCYYQNNVLDISKLNIRCNVKESFRIIHLSDLHSKEFGRNNNNLFRAVLKENPDIVLLTGDIIDSSLKRMDKVIGFIGKLNKHVLVVYIPGNNEMRCLKLYEILYKLEEIGVLVLKNEIETIKVKSNNINVLGLAEERQDSGEIFNSRVNCRYFYKDYARIFSELENRKGIKIVLSHYPENFEAVGKYSYSKYKFDIMFSGHAHGGQFILPFIGGLFAPGQGILPKYYRGIHGKSSKLIISRGLGNSGFPLRLFNRPEIVVVDIS